MLKHSHAKTCWSTVLLDAGSLEMVYVIETDLALSQDDPDFDAKAFESLVQAVRGYIAEHPSYDSARLEQILKA